MKNRKVIYYKLGSRSIAPNFGHIRLITNIADSQRNRRKAILTLYNTIVEKNQYS